MKESRYRVEVGDCRDRMKELEAESIDSIVTDPPYGLSFMGKEWDHGVPGVEFWTEAMRVAKPGAHLLAFGGTRTFHRLAVAIEDAGWEIRDCVMWVYGTGFPKSLNMSKEIDKMDASEEQEQRRLRFTAWVRSTGVTSRQINEATETNMGGHYTTAASQPAIMTREHLEACRHLLGDVPEWVEREADIRSIESKNMAARKVVGRRIGVDTRVESKACALAAQGLKSRTRREFDITTPATDAAKKWEGWGTALKPAWEPIIVARKPFVGTVAENVVRYGTGAMNVEGCRVSGTDHVENWTNARSTNIDAGKYVNPEQSHRVDLSSYAPSGRWPANLIHDGSEEVSDPLGSAARFFYCAKASKADRDDGCERNHHPTVKPTDLMAYLCRLVTPPGGTVLDPFTGSGSTGRGAMREGFNFIGFELSPEYAEIARARIAACVKSEALF